MSMTRRIVGWSAVAFSTAICGLWTFWGVVESFHEGWIYTSLWRNLALTVVHYLLVATIFTSASALSILWPRVGALLHGGGALFAAWFFSGAAPAVLYPFIVGPLLLLGAAYWYGRPTPRGRAVLLLVGVTLLVAVGSAIEPAIRIAGRVDDGDRGARRLSENGVDLIWAPAGPGWPESGVCWDEAVRRCRHLSADGITLLDEPIGVWRLPTVEEAVRSQCRHGNNAGGTWDPVARKATYVTMPDKESPLWDPHSQVIYWWTATDASPGEAWMIVYHGQVWPRMKAAGYGYLGFRAVREP